MSCRPTSQNDWTMAKIYVASSWRNGLQQQLVNLIREKGHQVYDFNYPDDVQDGFNWAEIDPNWKDWDVEEYKTALANPCAEKGFKRDFNAMMDAEVCVLLLPSGRSAHTEAGWMKGHGKKVVVLMTQPQEAELMYKLFDKVVSNTSELLRYLDALDAKSHDDFLVLNLNLMGRYYDMIHDGCKTEEYREIKPYWTKRLFLLNPEHPGNQGSISTNISDKTLQNWRDEGLAIETLIKEETIIARGFTHVCFRRGYTNTPLFVRLASISVGMGKPQWGAPPGSPVFILKLGEVDDIQLI